MEVDFFELGWKFIQIQWSGGLRLLSKMKQHDGNNDECDLIIVIDDVVRSKVESLISY
jgi:hypothetical protein